MAKSIAIRSRQALSKTAIKRLALVGGVAANRGIREQLKQLCDEQQADFFSPTLPHCTDNAAMVAYLGWRYWNEKGPEAFAFDYNLTAASKSPLNQL